MMLFESALVSCTIVVSGDCPFSGLDEKPLDGLANVRSAASCGGKNSSQSASDILNKTIASDPPVTRQSQERYGTQRQRKCQPHLLGAQLRRRGPYSFECRATLPRSATHYVYADRRRIIDHRSPGVERARDQSNEDPSVMGGEYRLS